MSSIKPRYYQDDQINSAVKAVLEGLSPVIASPTASGKSIVLCGIVDEIISAKPTWNILILSHVKEILEQNHAALEDYFGIEIGLYSAGLESRTIKKITVASIQSANVNKKLFKEFDLILIDEAHRVSFDKATGYRVFVSSVGAQCVGLTATNYRTKGGYLHEGADSLFNVLASDWTQLDKFNELTDEGFLSEIFSKKTALKMDTTGIKTLGGDFKTKELSEKFDRDNITGAAIIETLYFGKNYKSWLCFTIDIDHCEHVAKELNAKGIPSIAIHSEMKNRDKAIRDFKKGLYICAVTVEVLTTGFNHPLIDLIIMLRPTKSPIVHVQTIGRGLRTVYAEGFDLETKQGRLDSIQASQKKHCLVLDFAGNTKRLGPINDVKIHSKEKKKGGGEAMSRDCPECSIENHLAAKFCINCGYEFPREQKLKITASLEEIVKKDIPKKVSIVGWTDVKNISYAVHKKAGRPNCLKVTYDCGLISYDEYISVEGNGYAKHKANGWIKFRWSTSDLKIPKTVDECIMNQQFISKPKKILVDLSDKFPRIIQSEF